MDAEDAGQGGGDGIQPGQELRDQQRLESPREEDLLGATNTGIGLERDLAEPREHR
jgi:hypothetical protein